MCVRERENELLIGADSSSSASYHGWVSGRNELVLSTRPQERERAFSSIDHSLSRSPFKSHRRRAESNGLLVMHPMETSFPSLPLFCCTSDFYRLR